LIARCLTASACHTIYSSKTFYKSTTVNQGLFPDPLGSSKESSFANHLMVNFSLSSVFAAQVSFQALELKESWE